ncbi:MAG TPA: hypothetical protein VL147_22685 [Devosia sp.]|nr:hypothetical protein [Devosia sp.]
MAGIWMARRTISMSAFWSGLSGLAAFNATSDRLRVVEQTYMLEAAIAALKNQTGDARGKMVVLF